MPAATSQCADDLRLRRLTPFFAGYSLDTRPCACQQANLTTLTPREGIVSNAQAISINDALRALAAAQAQAAEMNVQACIVIVDSGGDVKALARMDGAPFLMNTLAQSKAVTAAGLGVATGDFAEAVSASPALLAGFSGQDIALLPGGVPLTVNGAIAGAIGVAGGTNGEDEPIAKAAMHALSS